MLHDQRVSAFPVIDNDNKVIGVVSETDLLTKEALEGTVPRTLQGLTSQHVRSQVNGVIAADLMTKPAVTIGPDEPVTHAARLMYDQRVKRLPVVSDDGTLIGIVTRSDVLSVYRRSGRGDTGARSPRTLSSAPSSATRTAFTVTVTDGIVTIEGTPETTAVGHDIIDAIRHAEGVVAVRDRLSYPTGPAVPHQCTLLNRLRRPVRAGATPEGAAVTPPPPLGRRHRP